MSQFHYNPRCNCNVCEDVRSKAREPAHEAMTPAQRDEIVATFAAGGTEHEVTRAAGIDGTWRGCLEVLRAELRSLLAMEAKLRERADADAFQSGSILLRAFAREILAAGEKEENSKNDRSR